VVHVTLRLLFNLNHSRLPICCQNPKPSAVASFGSLPKLPLHSVPVGRAMSACECSNPPEMTCHFQNCADLVLAQDGSKVRDQKTIALPFAPNEPFLLLFLSSCFAANVADVVKPSCGQMNQHVCNWKMMFLLLSL